MKKWLMPVAALLVGAVVGASVAVGVVILATRPSQWSEPALTRFEIIGLTETMIAGMPLPQGASWTKCVEGKYHAGNGLWIVTCNFYDNQQAKTQLYTRTYSISDQTGKLQR